MLYSRQTGGSVEDAVRRLEGAARERRFGVLGVIDLRARMAEKGVEFEPGCTIVEICNPVLAAKMLAQLPSLAASLPCRIAAYEEDGGVTVATVRPTALLALHPGSEALRSVAGEVEASVVAIVDAACEEQPQGRQDR